MKKLISVILASAMIAALGLTAFADNPITQASGSKNSEVVVKTVIEDSDETYSVTIPANLDIDWGDTTVHDMNPKVTSQLKLGAKITVTVTDEDSTNTLKNEGYPDGLAYKPTGLNEPFEFGAINDGAIPKEKTVSVQVESFAGVPIAVYQTTLTYTVEYTAPTA